MTAHISLATRTQMQRAAGKHRDDTGHVGTGTGRGEGRGEEGAPKMRGSHSFFGEVVVAGLKTTVDL